MVQSDIAQLSGECTEWRENLRNQREELNQCKRRLQETVTHTLSKEDFTEVEHYHNQFHIQLINIHDIKQAIKQHERRVNFELSKNDAVSEETLAIHEILFGQFQQMENTLEELRREFDDFSVRTQ
ncbi:MAG: hypothetical protein WDN26_20740 [Chitinophagaceae bacterium]